MTAADHNDIVCLFHFISLAVPIGEAGLHWNCPSAKVSGGALQHSAILDGAHYCYAGLRIEWFGTTQPCGAKQSRLRWGRPIGCRLTCALEQQVAVAPTHERGSHASAAADIRAPFNRFVSRETLKIAVRQNVNAGPETCSVHQLSDAITVRKLTILSLYGSPRSH